MWVLGQWKIGRSVAPMGVRYFSSGPTIFSGLTSRSNSSAVRWPRARAASLSVVPSLCAFLAISAALS